MLIYPENIDRRLKKIIGRCNSNILKSFYGSFREFSVYSLAGLRKWTDSQNIPNKRFFIFCRGRTGSTLLLRMLNASPDICAEEEILYLKTLSPARYIEAKSMLSRKTVYGFKMPVGSLIGVQGITDINGFVSALHQKNWSILHLKRTDLFRQVLSRSVAETRNIWHLDQKAACADKKVIINWKEISGRIVIAEKFSQLENDVLKGIPHLSLIYEDDLMNESRHQATCNKICNYLGIPSFTAKAPLQKILPENLCDFIENIDEGRTFFKNSGQRYICAELFETR